MLKMFVIGHLGQDALVKDVNGKKVIDFSIAHTERYMSQNAQQEKTVWVRCAYWTDKTNIAPYLKKGTQVFLEGAPSSNAYTNKEGQVVGELRLRVLSIQLLGSKPSQSGEQSASTQDTAISQGLSNEFVETSSTDDFKDDLPF